MKIKNILVPTDFSNYNDAALDFASTLAAEAGGTLHFVHVHDTRELGTALGEASFLYAQNWSEERDRAERRLQRIAPTTPDVSCDHHMLIGVPEAEIVAFAKDHHCDLIVMASHGRTGLTRIMMGSVAEAVMRHSTCPVLIVKQPAESRSKEATAVAANARTEH